MKDHQEFLLNKSQTDSKQQAAAEALRDMHLADIGHGLGISPALPVSVPFRPLHF